MAHLGNLTNEYAAELGAMFDEMPKAVLAAIAVSLATCGGDNLAQAKRLLAAEWEVLNLNGIVPQKPGPKARAAISKAESQS